MDRGAPGGGATPLAGRHRALRGGAPARRAALLPHPARYPCRAPRQGIGFGLLADNLRMVDAAGLPAYLEASNPANVVLYQRFGFQPHGSFVLPDGPEVVTMWREPRS